MTSNSDYNGELALILVKMISIKVGAFFLIIGLPGHLFMLWVIANGGIEDALLMNLLANIIAYMFPLTWLLPFIAIWASINLGNEKPSKVR